MSTQNTQKKQPSECGENFEAFIEYDGHFEPIKLTKAPEASRAEEPPDWCLEGFELSGNIKCTPELEELFRAAIPQPLPFEEPGDYLQRLREWAVVEGLDPAKIWIKFHL